MSPLGATTALLIGLGIGLLAQLVIPSRLRVPVWLTLAAGLIGALIGTFVAQAIGITATPGIDWAEIVLPTLTATTGVAAAASAYGRQSTAR
jgi:uncharacterized membrane protein YeaQ/YmgE (transglycosylase-associated protein family)